MRQKYEAIKTIYDRIIVENIQILLHRQTVRSQIYFLIFFIILFVSCYFLVNNPRVIIIFIFTQAM